MIFHQPGNSRGNFNHNTYTYSDREYTSHFHKNLELIYVISGKVECMMAGKSDILCEGDFGLCLSNEIHSYSPRENSRYWVGVFSEDFVRTFAKKTQGKTGDTFKFRCDDSVRNYFIHNLVETNEPTVYMLK